MKNTKKNKITTLKSKLSKKKSKERYLPTFILSMRDDGVEYNTDIFRKMIINLGLTETKNTTDSTSYLHMQHMANKKYESKYYNTPTLLMNILDDEKEVITNKSNLYENFYKKFPSICNKYMAKTWNIKKFNSKMFISKDGVNNVFIVRPVGIGAFSGVGIEVVSSFKDLTMVRRKLEKKFPTIIVSEYITNPMLWEGKKFHLRTYLLAKIINGILTTYFYDFYEVFTAEKPYIANNWHDMDIHDTHLKSVGKYIVGPIDFDTYTRKLFNTKIWPAMADCMKYVSKLLEKHAKPFQNSENAFEVLGCDFMITNVHKVKLLEVNARTGLSMQDFPDRRDEFSILYFGKIRDNVLIPLFNPDNKEKKEYAQEPIFVSKVATKMSAKMSTKMSNKIS